jgi:Sugar (and other) transporter
LYSNLGYSTVQQIIYPSAWLTAALGLNFLAIFIVDKFPRPKYMAFGVAGCMATLIIEAALIANFVPSDNTAALKAAVAMLFVFQIFYSLCLDGKINVSLLYVFEELLIYSRYPIRILGRGFPKSSSRQRCVLGCSHDLAHEHNLATICPYRIQVSFCDNQICSRPILT